MKVIMFAGADAMTDLDSSLTALTVPDVQKLLKRYGFFDNIAEHFSNMLTEPFPALAASVLTQVGLFQSYTKKIGDQFILAGCSMGDLAKLICAQVIDVETALQGIEKFTQGLQDVESGSIIHIKTAKGRDDVFFDDLKKFNLHLAMDQTTNDCLIAGREADIIAWQETSELAKNSKLQLILPFPLHSPLMEPAFSRLEKFLIEKPMRRPSIQIVSSVEPGPLVEVDAIRNDLKFNILGQIRWQETFKWMSDVLKVTEFVNVGPVDTLKILGSRIQTLAPVSIIDSV